jgi:beta-glucosidase
MTTIDARYRDATLPVDARVADLLARMTLDEKLAQLGSIWSFELFRSEAELDPERVRERLADGIGHISRVAGATNLEPTAAAEAGNAIQRFLVEETRLGIPALLHEETLHGLLARDAPIYQQSIGAAAAFDPELVEAIATAIRRRMRAIGATVALAPVLDICRDPRWGRVEETYGEDPYLAAVLGSAYVRGLQGTDLATGVAATAKHFAGHGLAEGGFNQAPAHIGPRELREEQLLPFEAAVRDAGIASVMPAYCDVDGVPCHASRELLTTILRDEWGFDGVVASDYTAVQMLVTEHRLTPDLGTAAAMALRAGMDSELPVTAAYGAPLREAIEDGRVDVLLVDLAVERLLRLKFRLGLFERPYDAGPPVDPAAGRLDFPRELDATRRCTDDHHAPVRQDTWIPVLQGSEARHIRRQTGAGRWDRGNIASSGRYHQLAAAPRPVVGFDLETSILLPDLRDVRSRPDRCAKKVGISLQEADDLRHRHKTIGIIAGVGICRQTRLPVGR